MLRIVIEREASKALLSLPRNIRELILNKIRSLAENPTALRNNVKRLSGLPESRLRVGDWRIIFRKDGDRLVISKIAPRGSAYD